MLTKAITASANVGPVASPRPSLRHTTRTRPDKPSPKPSHCLREARCVWPMPDNQRAVSSGCKPTIKDAVPADMPPLTAAHTPPR